MNCLASLSVRDRTCLNIGVPSSLPRGKGVLSLDIGNGCKGVNIGEERVVGVAAPTGEGVIAGIILAEDIIIELPGVFPIAISPDEWWRERVLSLILMVSR